MIAVHELKTWYHSCKTGFGEVNLKEDKTSDGNYDEVNVIIVE